MAFKGSAEIFFPNIAGTKSKDNLRDWGPKSISAELTKKIILQTVKQESRLLLLKMDILFLFILPAFNLFAFGFPSSHHGNFTPTWISFFWCMWHQIKSFFGVVSASPPPILKHNVDSSVKVTRLVQSGYNNNPMQRDPHTTQQSRIICSFSCYGRYYGRGPRGQSV